MSFLDVFLNLELEVKFKDVYFDIVDTVRLISNWNTTAARLFVHRMSKKSRDWKKLFEKTTIEEKDEVGLNELGTRPDYQTFRASLAIQSSAKNHQRSTSV